MNKSAGLQVSEAARYPRARNENTRGEDENLLAVGAFLLTNIEAPIEKSRAASSNSSVIAISLQNMCF